jgi:hypothetical protein
MARPKKRTSEPEVKASTFLDALKFCKLVTKTEGPPNETHLLLKDHWAIAFNGILACGHKITEDIYCAPNADLMTQALSKCGEHFSITQLDNNRLSIKSNKFKAIVPCIDPTLLGVAIPDAPIAIIDDRFKEAVSAVSVLASDTAQSVVAASVLMAGASVIATDRKCLMEYWHGIDLPYGIALPKIFANILTKINKKLTKFGFSQSSTTFYFEDKSWLRTQFFAEPWPDVRNILDRKCNCWPLPNEFYKAVDAIEPFSDEGNLFFDTGIMRSHINEKEGASYEIFGLPKGPIFAIKQLNIIRPYVEQIDFMAQGMHTNTMCMWFGKNCRGAIAGRE